MSKWLRKGQAEIIGGLMVASVLLLIIIPLILNTMTSSTTVGTRNYILRSQFEIERWSEKLVINGTKIVNPSPVEITIVRIWDTNGTPIDISPKNLLAGGGTIDITELYSGITSIHDLDALVTARGRVFKIEELIPPTPGGEGEEGGEAPLGLTGEEIVGGGELFNYDITVIRCVAEKTNCTDPIPAIYYNRSGTVGWWVNMSGGWQLLPTSQVRSGEEKYSDLDNNKAPELKVLYKNNGKYEVLKDNNQGYRFAIRISKYAYLKDDSKLIAVYMKVLTGSEGASRADTYVNISLVHSNNPSVMVSSYATLSSIKITSSNVNVSIYEGYVLFPVRQFNYFETQLSNYPGYYDLVLEVIVGIQDAKTFTSGIEYVAVTSI
ncbi:MAG: hypothetical protein QXZ10_02660 [Sulfolobales archaeon]